MKRSLNLRLEEPDDYSPKRTRLDVEEDSEVPELDVNEDLTDIDIKNIVSTKRTRNTIAPYVADNDNKDEEPLANDDTPYTADFIFATKAHSSEELKKIPSGLLCAFKHLGIVYKRLDKVVLAKSNIVHKVLSLKSVSEVIKRASQEGLRNKHMLLLVSLWDAFQYYDSLKNNASTKSDSELKQSINEAWWKQLFSVFEFDYNANVRVELPGWKEKPAYDFHAFSKGSLIFLMEKKAQPDVKGLQKIYNGHDVLRVVAGLRLLLTGEVRKCHVAAYYNDLERIGAVVAGHRLLLITMNVEITDHDGVREIKQFNVSYVSCDLSRENHLTAVVAILYAYFYKYKSTVEIPKVDITVKTNERASGIPLEELSLISTRKPKDLNASIVDLISPHSISSAQFSPRQPSPILNAAQRRNGIHQLQALLLQMESGLQSPHQISRSDTQPSLQDQYIIDQLQALVYQQQILTNPILRQPRPFLPQLQAPQQEVQAPQQPEPSQQQSQALQQFTQDQPTQHQ